LIFHIKGGTQIEEFENRVLRRIFGPKMEQVVRAWKIPQNEELHNLNASPYTRVITVIKPRRMRWAVHVERMEEMRDSYDTLFGNPEGKRPLGRPRRRWENIRMNLLRKTVRTCGLDATGSG
jgi:hypothetical protein